MKFKLSLTALVAGLFLLSTVTVVQGQQRSEYRRLGERDQTPSFFVDFITLPKLNKDEVSFSAIYSLAYSALSFKKVADFSNPSGDAFTSALTLSMEVFNSSKEKLRKKDRDVSIKGLESAARALIHDTARTETYEQTQSALEFLQGQLNTTLKPGIYSLVLELQKGRKSNSQMSNTHTLRIPSYDKMETGNVYLGEAAEDDQSSKDNTFKLISLGENVRYGEDFKILAYLPKYKSGQQYTLSVSSLDVTNNDTTKKQQIYSSPISEDQISNNVYPVLASHGQANVLRLKSATNGYAYAQINIPNSRFPNDRYRLVIKEKDSGKIAAQTVFRSMWIDMPRSLLSLDFATKMLHYIVNDKTITRLSEGSRAERKQNFRDFWKEKDPTPKTEYNELMAEYYRRIDYAYKHYSSGQKPGYETDQGRIYITHGPPRNIQRKFPANEPTMEI